MTIEKLIRENQGTIVDVRTRSEFSSGHVSNSINIPLQELEQNLSRLKAMRQPLILCCASGGRSGSAEAFLRAQGIECWNAGSWLNVNYYLTQN
jgi:phage shock protein E